MPRERKIHTAADGSLYYELKRSRKIDVPGTKGLLLPASAKVPQIEGKDNFEETVQVALNVIEAKNETERLNKFVDVINQGLVKVATDAITAELNQKINSSQIVSDFAAVVNLTKTMLPDLSEKERAQAIIERFPEVASKLTAAGLELITEDTETDDEEDDEG